MSETKETRGLMQLHLHGPDGVVCVIADRALKETESRLGWLNKEIAQLDVFDVGVSMEWDRGVPMASPYEWVIEVIRAAFEKGRPLDEVRLSPRAWLIVARSVERPFGAFAW